MGTVAPADICSLKLDLEPLSLARHVGSPSPEAAGAAPQARIVGSCGGISGVVTREPVAFEPQARSRAACAPRLAHRSQTLACVTGSGCGAFDLEQALNPGHRTRCLARVASAWAVPRSSSAAVAYSRLDLSGRPGRGPLAPASVPQGAGRLAGRGTDAASAAMPQQDRPQGAGAARRSTTTHSPLLDHLRGARGLDTHPYPLTDAALHN